MSLSSENKYSKLQKAQYEREANEWSVENRNPVVGSFDAHNSWNDYENLFKNMSNLSEKKVLDFGCGPGRNLVKYEKTFKQIDGIDISEKNLEKAIEWIQYNNLNVNKFRLYISNGIDCSNVENNEYDIIISTICLQHICVYEIRYNIFKEFYRILKKGGHIAIQMGYGKNSPQTVGYFDNFYEASGTNRTCDVCIENPNQIESDLQSIGFKNFQYTIGQTGPGDCHPNWIYFNVEK
jgi:ubiquinone/menaquinone biosynthesis C-methylase UbiE